MVIGKPTLWKPKRCPSDCIYRGATYDKRGLCGCNYLSLTDQLRGCEPGNGCTKYTNDASAKPEMPCVVLSKPGRKRKPAKWDVGTGFAMWLVGFKAPDIARELGVRKQTVYERIKRYWSQGEL